MKYIKKTDVIEVMEFETNNDPNNSHMDLLVDWMNETGDNASHDNTNIHIKTFDGIDTVSVGDYIVKRDGRDFCILNPNKFEILENQYYTVGELSE